MQGGVSPSCYSLPRTWHSGCSNTWTIFVNFLWQGCLSFSVDTTEDNQAWICPLCPTRDVLLLDKGTPAASSWQGWNVTGETDWVGESQNSRARCLPNIYRHMARLTSCPIHGGVREWISLIQAWELWAEVTSLSSILKHSLQGSYPPELCVMDTILRYHQWGSVSRSGVEALPSVQDMCDRHIPCPPHQILTFNHWLLQGCLCCRRS